MNLERVNEIAKAVLYEGYMLYPYRPSSVKNHQRFNFGVLYPQAHSDAQNGSEPFSMRTECLICDDSGATLEIKLRFLQLHTRWTAEPSATNNALPEGWQEAAEREVSLPLCPLEATCGKPLQHAFNLVAGFAIEPPVGSRAREDSFLRKQEAIQGSVEVTAEKVGDDLFKVCVLVRNSTLLTNPACSRDEALMHSLVSTHTILGVEGGAFVSLLDPPEALQQLASECQNAGAWPVLVGDEGQRDTMLASPIILYDYPQIAPESAGDLFDGTEIDEILSLRIMTLTDDEKREIRQTDDRARQILERTENMPAEQFMKLHGAVRGLRPVISRQVTTQPAILQPPQEDTP
jgi:hypothetical protein